MVIGLILEGTCRVCDRPVSLYGDDVNDYLKEPGEGIVHEVTCRAKEEKAGMEEPKCTLILGTGDWPFTNPIRCGDPAIYHLVDESGDEGYSCVVHAGRILGGRGVTITDLREDKEEGS